MKRVLTVLTFLIVLLALSACAFGLDNTATQPTTTPIAAQTPATREPDSLVRLVEDENGVPSVLLTGNDQGAFDNVDIEEGMAHAQLLCETKHSVSVPSPSNEPVVYTTEECPDLLDGILIQLVSTSTVFEVGCRNCAVTMHGFLENGDGVTVWRGMIWITPIDDDPTKVPALLLYPLTQQ